MIGTVTRAKMNLIPLRQNFPAGIFKKLGALGILGALVDREYGGAGIAYPEYALVIEERNDRTLGQIPALNDPPWDIPRKMETRPTCRLRS